MARESRRDRRSKSCSRSRSRSVEKETKRSRSRDRTRSRRSRSKDRRRSRSRDRRDRKRSRSRDRKRSKSRERKDRKRSRSRSRERKERSKRSRSRERRRSRSHDRKKSKKSKSRSRSKSREETKIFDPTVLDKEEAEKQLEAEMRKRRERIEKWRAEKKKKELEMTKKEAEKGTLSVPKASTKSWNLEDDDDEEDAAGEKKDDADDEVDPLDAFMTGIQEEVRRINRAGRPLTTQLLKKEQEADSDCNVPDAALNASETTNPAPATTTTTATPPADSATITSSNQLPQTTTTTAAGVVQKNGSGGESGGGDVPVVVPVKKPVIITGVATKQSRKKGELMEQNQDGLEYSSEEEGEDLKDTMLSIAKKGRKELAKVDHQTVEYVAFRKDFYIEVPEIASMTKEEVDTYREELEGIKVKGVGCPRPIKSWPQCGVSKRTLDVLKKCKYEKPTPIQAQAIPAIMSGRDVIGIAKTGSGKTLAFLLPLIRHVVDQPPLLDTDGPIAIIMTPTRELAMQIGRECRRFCRSSLRIAVVYGGTGISEQIAELKRGAEIIVCTPGRMIDMLAANNGRVTNLKRVSYIVLDEADRMFDLGFEPQVMRIIENVQPGRQTVMFSATFPRQVEALAKKILQKPIEIMVGGRSVVCKDVSQHVIILDEDDKFLKLLELLGQFYEQGQIIVFVDKQESADSLYKDLLSHSYRAIVLHGGVDQIDRDTNIMDFKAGRVPILVATSVAARGLDVKQLVLVVNFDAPNHYEDYVHRCGRTGRAGNKGHAYTFLSTDQPRYAGNIIRALEMSETSVPQELHDLWNAYKAKMELEGKKVKTGGGFHGRGFKFDDEEANFATEKKKFQKAALGLQDSDDEDIEGDIEQHIIKLLNTKRTVKEVKPAPLISPSLLTGLGGAQAGAPVPLMTIQGLTPPASAAATAASKLELAKRLAQKFNAQHGAGGLEGTVKGASQQAAEFVMKGGTSMQQPAISAKTVAEQMAQKLNNRLNYQPTGDADSEDNPNNSTTDESYHKYEEELEINDFPQQARWRVTSKEALAQISEYSEAGITVRGTFCPSGKNPPDGERKLFLAIESTSELAVSKAKAEIIRLIREELVKLRTSGGGLKSQGRYKVL